MKLAEVFDEATRDPNCLDFSEKTFKAFLVKGVKIVKDIATNEVKIYNTFLGGEYHQEINRKQYGFFKREGWRRGVDNVMTFNLTHRIENIQNAINEEESTTRNMKRIRSLIKQQNKIQNELQRITDRRHRSPY